LFIRGKNNIYRYMVRKPQELRVIVEHFDKYPLITQKLANFKLFKKAVEILCRKEHLTSEGLRRLVAIKASMNLGLSEELKAAFPDIVPVPRPLVDCQDIKNPNWLSGFASAEGCFLIKLKQNKLNDGYFVTLRFQLTQHAKDEQLLRSLEAYLSCGRYENQKGEWGNFVCTKFADIDAKIIPGPSFLLSLSLLSKEREREREEGRGFLENIL